MRDRRGLGVVGWRGRRKEVGGGGEGWWVVGGEGKGVKGVEGGAGELGWWRERVGC